MKLFKSLMRYLPLDRYLALSQGKTLPIRAVGVVLVADISGFTPLTETLTLEYGPQRGSEELTQHLNAIYDPLVSLVH